MPRATEPVVTVVVVTHNSEGHVGALLDSLPAALGDLPWRTVVVDNGSTDRTLALLEGRPDCAVVPSWNAGFAAGVNRGVREAGGDGPILVVNPDATLSPGAVPVMVAALARPRVGIVVPRVSEADGRLSWSLRRDPTLARVGGLSFTGLGMFSERVSEPAAYRREHVVDWAMGAVLLIDRECYRCVGGIEESYFLYSEETDLCLRARDLGWLTLYTPDAHAMHVGGGSGESARTHTMKILNRVRLYRRLRGDARAYLYFAGAVVTELRRALLGRRESWTALDALLRPTRRPAELRCGPSLLPAVPPLPAAGAVAAGYHRGGTATGRAGARPPGGAP